MPPHHQPVGNRASRQGDKKAGRQGGLHTKCHGEPAHRETNTDEYRQVPKNTEAVRSDSYEYAGRMWIRPATGTSDWRAVERTRLLGLYFFLEERSRRNDGAQPNATAAPNLRNGAIDIRRTNTLEKYTEDLIPSRISARNRCSTFLTHRTERTGAEWIVSKCPTTRKRSDQSLSPHASSVFRLLSNPLLLHRLPHSVPNRYPTGTPKR